jgi:hypothetical protein
MTEALEPERKIFVRNMGLKGQLSKALPVLCLSFRTAADQAWGRDSSLVEDVPSYNVVDDEAIAVDGVEKWEDPATEGVRVVAYKQASKQARACLVR